MTDTIRLLIVDDHLVVRKGICHVLNSADGIDVVGEAEHGEEGLFLCQKLKPDLVLMDVKMGGIGGIEATRLFKQYYQQVKVIGLSTFAQSDIVNAMMEAGASGYLLKDISASELSDSIRRIHTGETILPELGLDENIESSNPSSGVPADAGIELGEQQRKVLALMTKGFTNPEIAGQLGISSPTARYHVSAILRKLDVSNRSEAVALAISLKLVRPEDF